MNEDVTRAQIAQLLTTARSRAERIGMDELAGGIAELAAAHFPAPAEDAEGEAAARR